MIKAAPNFGEAHYNLGLNLWNKYKSSTGLRQKSDLDEALEELKTASQLSPETAHNLFRPGPDHGGSGRPRARGGESAKGS